MSSRTSRCVGAIEGSLNSSKSRCVGAVEGSLNSSKPRCVGAVEGSLNSSKSRRLGAVKGSQEPIEASGLLRGGSMGIGGLAWLTALESHFHSHMALAGVRFCSMAVQSLCRALLRLQPSPSSLCWDVALGSAGLWTLSAGPGGGVPSPPVVPLTMDTPQSSGPPEATGNSTKLASPPRIS
ncbi:hypothetical protein AAY473_002286 [Plecturocebus cupreus]